MTFIAIYQIRVTFSGSCFVQTINKVIFFECVWTEARVCTDCSVQLKWGHRTTGSGRHQTYWLTGQSTGLCVVFLALFYPASRSALLSSCLSSSFSVSEPLREVALYLFLPTMCRHIACGVICLVFVILFDDLLNVLIIFVLFFLVNHFTRWA